LGGALLDPHLDERFLDLSDGGLAAGIVHRLACAGTNTAERYKKIDAYVKHYKYAPTRDLRTVAEDLYTEVGSITMTLIGVKVARVRDSL
jgi:hypothetical protein